MCAKPMLKPARHNSSHLEHIKILTNTNMSMNKNTNE